MPEPLRNHAEDSKKAAVVVAREVRIAPLAEGRHYRQHSEAELLEL